MTISPPPAVILSDMFFCLGLGLLLAAALDGLRFILPGQVGQFLLDVLGFGLAAVLLYSFGAGRSGAGVPRWFHGAGLLAGILAYEKALSAGVARVRNSLWNRLLRPLQRVLSGRKTRRKAVREAKRKGFSKKVSGKPEKQLPKKGRMLYNS